MGSFSRMWDVGEDEPSVMIVAINVQHLLPLDAEDTALQLAAVTTYGEEYIRTRKGRILSILFNNKVSTSISCGPTGGVVPVPRTTTSYSGATSSMIAVGVRMY